MSSVIQRGGVTSAVLIVALIGPLAVLQAGEDPAKAQLQALTQRAMQFYQQGKSKEATELWEQVVRLAPKAFGPDHPDVASALNNLAILYESQGRYAEAEPLYRRSLAIREAKLGSDHPAVASVLNNLAGLYQSQGRSAEAEPLFRRSLKIYEAKLGPDHPDVASALNNLAELYRTQGRSAEAEPLYGRSLTIREAKLGPDHPDVAQSLNNLAGLYQSQGRSAEAEPLFRRSLKIYEAKLGPDHPDVAQSLNNLAGLYLDMGRSAEAEPLFRRSLKIDEAKLGPDHPDVAYSLNNLAELYRSQGRYAEAEPLCRRSLAIREAALGPDHPDVAQSLNNLAGLYQSQGRYAEAEPLYRRSLTIREAKLGRDHPDVATSLNNLANLYQSQGRYADAEPLYRRGLKIDEAALGPDHPDVAPSLNNLAGLYRKQGRYADAEPLYRRSLKIKEAALGPDHPDVAQILNNLAGLYRTQGRYTEAEPLCRRSLKIDEAALGPDHPDVAHSLNNLALLYESQGRYADAEPLYRRSLKIDEAALGPDHPDVATKLNNLANLYQSQGRYADAEPLYRRGLKIDEAALGPDHPDVAHSLNNLALLYESQGRYADAEPLYRRSLKIKEAAFGPDHPDVAQILNNLAGLQVEQGQWTEAVSAFDRARRTILRHVVHVLPALSERDQLTFLKATDEPEFHGALSLAVAHPDDPATAERSAGWVLNGKGLTQQALAQRALLTRSAQDPAAAQIVGQLRDVRNTLAARTLALPRPGQEEDRTRALARLAARERELSRELGQVTGRPTRDDPWIELDRVRTALPGDAVLVEIARFDVFEFLAKDRRWRLQPAHYAAWVLPAAGRGAVLVIDLGPAETIDAAVAAARGALRADPQALRDRGEPDLERRARPTLEALARRVLTPLLPHIGPTRRWILSPDAALWLVPWAALPLDGGRYALEDHEIAYVVSGRDLVPGGGRPAHGQALVMADPDFALDPDQARQAARAVLRRADRSSADELALRGPSGALRLDAVRRLPGTAAEARAIAPKLRAYAGAAPVVYTDRWALEAVFKAFRQPRVVVLSTHGFFLEDQETKPEVRPGPGHDPARPVSGPLSENPLLRCGLLLAGCSRRDPAGEGEDGVLTGMEIVGTDLRDTELVVLSACETGLGQVRNGEGVAGLRQAFQLAGAEAVVATLWQVPDKESARLMSAFFDNLAAGKGKTEALRAAQLALIRSRRERYGAAHPFFWAAYTVTGKDSQRPN